MKRCTLSSLLSRGLVLLLITFATQSLAAPPDEADCRQQPAPEREAEPSTTEVHLVGDEDLVVWRHAADKEPLCRTPCTVRLPSGKHRFEVESEKVEIHARGAPQIWHLKDDSPAAKAAGGAMAVTGALALGGGLVSALLGALIASLGELREDSDLLPVSLAVAGIGGVTMASGLVLALAVGPASAEQATPLDKPPPARGMTVGRPLRTPELALRLSF